ncbi:RNA-directed DNA polymerase, eukaryota [Tanacetum coccineum]
MGSFRSKEDDVSKISTSIFVTNFPYSFSAKDLFHSCKQYGHVVDSFIPTKRTKDGKRFGFVRFINVFNVERLVNNLCTIWVGRSKFHANVARFKREYMKGSVNVDKTKNESNKRKFDGSHKNVENTVIGKSFVSVVKTSRMPIDKESPPAIVLEDDCLNAKDLTLSLMGRVKEMASLVNLKKALCNEGFDVVKISYLGELWVLLEFETAKAKDSFRGNVGVGSWFSVIKQAYAEFVPEGRLVWVELDGVPFKFWSGPTFKRIAAKWGELLDVDDYDESNLHSKRICILSKVCEHIHESFKIVFRGKVYWVRASEVLGWTPEFSEEEEEDELSVEDNNDGRINDLEANNCIDESDVEEVTEEDHSWSHPPGFTPDEGLNEGNTVNLDLKDYGENDRDDNSFVNLEDGKDNSESVNSYSESKLLGHSMYSVLPRTGGSILNLMEEVVKVGQTMGYNMDGCIKDITEIIESQGEFGVNFVGLQETKMGSIDLSSVRSCWGNFNFDYVHSDSVGNSGGILCIWDPNSFRRSSFTRSDYFVIVRGVWLKSGIDLMIVVVYAPQEAKEKRMLWDYLAHVSNQWVGKLVMMGDFNEVRYKSDRYGSNFNAHDAEIFNSFIYNAGLDEVPLGGSAYTWCLKSASKMSKLDRFFVSENLLSMCPNITAITLERFISDHRPILLREVRYDYGPIPFRFYRYWLEVDGFDKLVRDSWNVAPVNKKNAIRNFMGKLKFLKDRIRSWLSIHRSNSRGEIYFLKEELRSCDEVIDKGDCSNEVVHKRTEILNKIHQVNNIQASEIAQKAKIKWAIEGDENVKFFHGMLNKKRNQSNIRGIMVNGTWVDDPVQVKREFFEHFRGRFDKPLVNRACIDTHFPVSLSIDQKEDMERMISKEEVKRDVMDCVVDKSPGWTSIVHKVRVLQGRGINVVDYIRLSREWGEHAVLADNWYEGVSSNSVLHITHFEKKSEKVNFEEMQLNSLAEISSMTTLVPCENRYVWTLESTGLFSASIRIGEIEWNRFRKLVCADWWVKSVPIKIMRKISSWWNIDYLDVNSYEEWQVWLVSIRIQSKLKGVLQGVYYGVNSDVKRRSSGTIGLRTLILFLFDLAPC